MMLLRTVHFHVLWDFNVSSPSCVLFWLDRTSVAKCVLRYLVYIDEVICPTILIMDNDHLLSYPQYHVVNYWQGWIVWQRLTWSGRFILYILKKWYQGWMSHLLTCDPVCCYTRRNNEHHVYRHIIIMGRSPVMAVCPRPWRLLLLPHTAHLLASTFGAEGSGQG